MEIFERGRPVKICAPMVRYSKLAFRNLVRLYDVDIAFSPMILADSFYNSGKARDNELTTNNEDNPLIVQFAASEAHYFAGAAQLVAQDCMGVDLNCGCPQRWAEKEGIGSCLINKPEFVADVVRQTRARVPRQDFSVSVKIRIHADIKRTIDLCRQVEAAGVSFISVHGRRRDQRTEPVNLEAIREIKASLSVPVVANGDIKSLADMNSVVEMTGVDGVMAARGLLENPAMFAGYAETPRECLVSWVRLSLLTGTPFSCFHHHLSYMTENLLPYKAERKVFNALQSTAAVLDFMRENWGLELRPGLG